MFSSFLHLLTKSINVPRLFFLVFSRIHTKAEYIIAENPLFVKGILKISYKYIKVRLLCLTFLSLSVKILYRITFK